jgi:hypothetical protein
VDAAAFEAQLASEADGLRAARRHVPWLEGGPVDTQENQVDGHAVGAQALTARIGVSASSQRHTPPAQSSTRSPGSIPGQTPLSTGASLRGGSPGSPNGTTSTNARKLGSAR